MGRGAGRLPLVPFSWTACGTVVIRKTPEVPMLVLQRAAVAVILTLFLPVPVLAAPDCDGGTLGKLHVVGDRLRFAGTVTRRGATHATFVGGGPFQLRIVDTLQDDEVYAVDVPADRFMTRGRVTSYDHGGAFTGS